MRANSTPARNAPVIAATAPTTSADHAISSVISSAVVRIGWLIGQRAARRSARGMIQPPSSVAPTRNSAMRATISSTPARLPAPLASATNSERIKITSTSSITAAPSSASPTRERSLPSSSSVCAEMLTLVAVSSTPTNSEPTRL